MFVSNKGEKPHFRGQGRVDAPHCLQNDDPHMAHRVLHESREKPSFIHSRSGQWAFLLLSIAMQSLAFAPFKQFYFAWVGIVPMLWVAGRSKTLTRAVSLTWLGGIIFYMINVWWLGFVSWPGMVGLNLFQGFYWGGAVWIIRGSGWLGCPPVESATPKAHGRDSLARPPVSPVLFVLGVAAIWTTFDYARGFFFTGFPWLYLGHAMSPILIACQIADLFGAYGVTFCVVAVNALIYLYLVRDRRTLRVATAVVVLMWAAAGAYGLFRLMEAKHFASPGLRVMVAQSNFLQNNSGQKGAGPVELYQFHMMTTEQALQDQERQNQRTDLVCWSETMMPAMNDAALGALLDWPTSDPHADDRHYYGEFASHVRSNLSQLSQDRRVNLLAGGEYAAQFDQQRRTFHDRRNSAYLFRPETGSPLERSDKIHLVPFGEYMPFKGSHWLGWLYSIFQWFNPYQDDYGLTPGAADSPTVFTLHAVKTGIPVRVVVPICYEDSDAILVTRMFGGNQGKRADALINLTNDGWFTSIQSAQHLQVGGFSKHRKPCSHGQKREYGHQRLYRLQWPGLRADPCPNCRHCDG